MAADDALGTVSSADTVGATFVGGIGGILAGLGGLAVGGVVGGVSASTGAVLGLVVRWLFD